MLPGREQRSSQSPLGAHRGSEAGQNLVVVKTESAVPVSIRLAEPLPSKITGRASNPRTGKVMRPSRCVCHSQYVRTCPETKVSISGGDSGPRVSHGIRDSRAKDPGMRSDHPGPPSTGITVSSGGVPARPTHGHLSDDSSRATSSEMASGTGNQSHPQGSPATVVGSNQGTACQVSLVVDVTGQGFPFALRPLR